MVFGHKERRLVGWIVIQEQDVKSGPPLKVRLELAGSIKGVLVDEDGLPWAGATFYVQPHYPDRRILLGPVGKVFGRTERPLLRTPEVGSRSMGSNRA